MGKLRKVENHENVRISWFSGFSQKIMKLRVFRGFPFVWPKDGVQWCTRTRTTVCMTDRPTPPYLTTRVPPTPPPARSTYLSTSYRPVTRSPGFFLDTVGTLQYRPVQNHHFLMLKRDLFKIDCFAKKTRVLVGEFRILPFWAVLTKSVVFWVFSGHHCLPLFFTVLDMSGFP